MNMNTEMNGPARTAFGRGARAVLAAVLLAVVAAAMPAHAAETTTFHFDNIPVRSALQLLAEEGDFNLVVSDSVQGNITLHLEDVTWEQVLAIVLRLNGLEQHVDGDTRSVTAGS
jgi:type II secretory pathway component HofQ